jgi:hypothetical protein
MQDAGDLPHDDHTCTALMESTQEGERVEPNGVVCRDRAVHFVGFIVMQADSRSPCGRPTYLEDRAHEALFGLTADGSIHQASFAQTGRTGSLRSRRADMHARSLRVMWIRERAI